MNAAVPGRYFLQLRLRLARFGLGNGVVCLLWLLGIGVWHWAYPQLRAQVQTQQSALSGIRKALRAIDMPAPPSPKSVSQERLEAFHDALGEANYVEEQVKTFLALAAKNNLKLNTAEYRMAVDGNGRFRTYQAILPVKGTYRAIRQFCEQTLLAIPFASLDEIGFRRDTIVNTTLEARLRFTLYVNEAPSTMDNQRTMVAATDGKP